MRFLWVAFTLLAAAGQTARNATQRELTPQLGAAGATLVRFVFGFPFALLFLAAVLAWRHSGLPAMNWAFALWCVLGAFNQIGGTALMLMTMERRSFVVTIAYLKTEPVLVALLGLVFLGDALNLPMTVAIAAAMAGVALISVQPNAWGGGLRPAALGLASAALFAASAIGYRGAILALHTQFVLGATISLAVGLTLQTLVLLAWLLLFQRSTLKAVAALWKPSLLAGFTGAAASQCWFLAFALTTAASVRTLALVEVLFAQGVSRFVLRQKTTARDACGIALLLAGAALIVWVTPSS